MISCGITELEDIGGDKLFPPTAKRFAAAIRGYYGTDMAMILASLTTKQKPEIKFVKSVGFKQVGKALKNPNSGNDILLFKKDITDKDRKKYKIGEKYRKKPSYRGY
jgi:hypothetical protein